ncbi:hypothetical protein LO763_11520 [Glycomyces sp. A-F 0318]|uniref:BTAD domain-containing putative transcriptional regulator n=1 Tax=Glycomyces amatae TaxID=2881355 RepID=UPI001E4CCB91|nr:BTAD domain-containing putative transcriptional regulator [Glycomyces amatae]MCD0444250.1 hypothetical protein [Glycomyces amatae]
MTRIAADRHRSHLAEPVRLPSLAARTAAGIIAGLGLGALLAGVPFMLLAALGWPPPFPNGTAWKYPHLFTNEFLTSALAWAGWVTWAWLAVIILREAAHALRWGISPEHLRDAASPVRWLAGALIGAVAALWPATAGVAAPAPAATTTSLELDDPDTAADNPARPLVWRIDTTTAPTTAGTETTTGQANTSEPATDPATGLRVVTVGPHNPTLWDIAETHLGDGSRYMEIFDLNQDRDIGDGDRLTQPWVVLDGWELLIPDTDTAPAVDEATGLRVVTVGPHNPTLWDIAETHLGDPIRYMEIFELNKDRTFAGGPFDDPDEVNDGWRLLIPDTEPEESPATEPPPVPPEGEGEVVEPPAVDPIEPDEDKTEPDTEASSSPAASSDPEEPEQELSQNAGSSLAESVPFGVWLAAGTCLAAGTVVALAHGLRRRRSQRERLPEPLPDEVITGRLSDLEAIIETEARKLAEPLPEPNEPLIVAEPVVGVGTDRTPVALSDLAAAGVGLRGPGQRGATRAAILTAIAARARILVTEAADLRLELGVGAASDQVRFTAGLDEALDIAGDGDTVVVCADTDLDESTRPMLERFLAATGGRSAFILGHWIPSSLVLEADGTVQAAHGRSTDAGLRSLHIADQDTTAAVLAGLAAPNAEPEDGVLPEPADLHSNGQADTAPAATPVRPETGPVLRLCLFGQPDAYLDGQLVPLKKGRRSRAFLTVLACADGPIRRDELLEGVVGDMVEIDRAKNNFSAVAIDTRRALREATGDHAAEFYTYERATETYELERHRFIVDLDEFNDAEQAAALASDPAKAVEHLEAAVALYMGDLAPEVDTDAVSRLRDLYRDKAIRILAKLVEYYLGTGDTASAEHHRARRARLTDRVGA